LCVVVFIAVAWGLVCYVHNRVWMELPDRVLLEAHHLTPTYGCVMCETSLRGLFACTDCSIYNGTVTAFSRGRAEEWVVYSVSQDFPHPMHRYIHYLARNFVLSTTTNFMTHVQLLQLLATVAYVLTVIIRECDSCRRHVQEFRKQKLLKWKQQAAIAASTDTIHVATLPVHSFKSLFEDDIDLNRVFKTE
jgi:hypothetical protein